MARTVIIGTTPTLIAAALPASRRSWVMIENPATAGRVWVSTSAAIEAAVGFALEPTPSQSSTLFAGGKPGQAAWYGIVASGTQSIVVEEGAGGEASRGNDSKIVISKPARTPYDMAVDNGFTGTEAEWLATLQVSEPLPADILRGTVDGDGVMVAITDRDGTPITEVPYVP